MRDKKPETKTVQELIELVCLRCSGSGHVPTKEIVDAILKSRWVSEAEHLKLQEENTQLKAVRDALGRSNKNALADRNTFIKKAEVLEGRLEDYGKCLWKAVQGDFEFLWKEYGEEDASKLSEDAQKLKQMLHAVVKSVGLTRLSELQKRLEAIKQHYERFIYPIENNAFTEKWLVELGVLLSEPKSEGKK